MNRVGPLLGSHALGQGHSHALGLLGIERSETSAQSCATGVLPILLEVGVSERVGLDLHFNVVEPGPRQQTRQSIWIGNPARLARPANAEIIEDCPEIVGLRHTPGGHTDPAGWLEYAPHLAQRFVEARKEHQAKAAEYAVECRIRKYEVLGIHDADLRFDAPPGGFLLGGLDHRLGEVDAHDLAVWTDPLGGRE
jgi:hypothetical protein